MEKQEFDSRIDEFFDGKDMSKNIPESIKEECERLVTSGGIDLERAKNNYRIPKLVLVVAMENVATRYEPPTQSDMDILNNLRKF